MQESRAARLSVCQQAVVVVFITACAVVPSFAAAKRTPLGSWRGRDPRERLPTCAGGFAAAKRTPLGLWRGRDPRERLPTLREADASRDLPPEACLPV